MGRGARLVEVDDALAVRLGAEGGLVRQHLLQLLVVVDLAVDRQRLAPAI